MPYQTDGNQKSSVGIKLPVQFFTDGEGCHHHHPRYTGHQDFSEDTYRIAMAADKAAALADVAKGVEACDKEAVPAQERASPIYLCHKIDHFGRNPSTSDG